MSRESDSRELVLITGSSGLLGSALVSKLADEYDLVGLDIDSPGDEVAPSIDWQKCDMSNTESIRSALNEIKERHGERIASVVHLAAYYDFSGAESPLYNELTVEGTRALLRHLQPFDVGQFVFSSTMLVLAPSEDGQPLDESAPLKAEWDYPRSKIDAEQVIERERGPIPAVILRLAGVYDDACHSPPISQQIRRIHQKDMESYFFPGDSERGQSFVHLDDTVEAIRCAVRRRAELGDYEVFLVGEPGATSYETLQERIGELIHGKEWPAIRLPKPVAKVGAWAKNKIGSEDEEFIKPWMIDLADAHYPMSIDRARERLGWEPRHRLEDSLSEMIRRLEADPERWYKDNGMEPPKRE